MSATDYKCRNQGDNMRYKITTEISASELSQYQYNKIIPQYKSQAGAADINWIHENKNIIVDGVCEHVWDRYNHAFVDDKILSKNKFIKLVKTELNLTCKIIRLTENDVKYCFVKKS